MPAAIPIVLGAIAAAAPYAATAGAAFATGTFLALAGIGAALGALPILLNQIFGPAVPAPTASGKYQNVQINTYTRVGRIPVVYGFRRVGANIIQLGHLEFENITNGGVLEQHLFAEVLMAFAEGPGSEILTLYVEDSPQRPSVWREYLGLSADEEPIVDELVDDTPTDRLPSYPNTIKAFFDGDLGFVSNIPNFAADIRGIYPTIERSGDASYCPGYSVDWKPRTAALDGPTNTAWFLVEDAEGYEFPSGMITWRMPYEGGRAIVQYTESPAEVEQTIERAWYMGMINAVVVQDPLDLTTFYAAKPGTESDGDWVRMSFSAIFRNPILFDHYDDRTCRLHTVHQRGDVWFIHIQSFIDGASRWISLPTDFGSAEPFDTMLAFTFKPEDNNYYAVIQEGENVPTAMRFDLTRLQWIPILGLGGTPHDSQTIRGLVKLGVYLYLVYDESVWQIDLSDDNPAWEEIDRADFFDVSEQDRMSTTPDVLYCSYCTSRYMGVTLFKNSEEWNFTAWYGPRIEGEQYATEQLFTRYAFFDAEGAIRWIDNGEDAPMDDDVTWVTTGPATDLSVAGVISAGNDYKTVNPDENLVTLMNGPGPSSATYKDRKRSESATGGFGAEPEKVRAIMYDRNPRFDSGYGEDRRDYWVEYWPEKDNDPESDYGHLDGTPGQPNGGVLVGNVTSPKKLPASTAPAIRAPYNIGGKAIWFNHMPFVTHDADDPDRNARLIVLQIINREPLIYRTEGESVYRRPAPNEALVVDTNFGTNFYGGFPLIQFEARPNGLNDAETKDFIQEELGEEEPENQQQWDGRWDLHGIYLDEFDVEQTVLIAEQVKVAEWDAQGTVVFGEGKATVVDMSIAPTSWRHQWWRRLVTPASEVVDMLTNTRYGRGVSEDRIDLHSYLAFHGYCVEWVRVDDELIQRYIFNHIVNQEQSLSDFFDEVFGPALAYDVSSSDRYKVAFENSNTQPLIEFTPSMMKPGSFSSAPKSPKVAVNRVRVRFYNVSIHDEDERTVDDEFDQDITGSIREKELPLATVTDNRRASLMARQVLESPIADRSTCSFVTGAFARILEPADIIAVTHPKGNFVRRPYRIVSVLDAGTDEVRIECQEVSPYTIDLAVIGGEEVPAESAIAAAGRDTTIPSQSLADTSIEDFSLEPLMPFRAVMAIDSDDSLVPLAHRAPNGTVTVSVRSTWQVGDIGYLSEPTVYEPLSAALPTVSGDSMLLIADGFLRPRVGTFTTPKTAFVVVRRNASPDYHAIERVLIEELVEPPSIDPKSTGTISIVRTPGEPDYAAVTATADRVWGVTTAPGDFIDEGYYADGRPIPASAWNNPGEWTDLTDAADPFGATNEVILAARRDWLVIGIGLDKEILPNVLEFVFAEPASGNLRLRWEYSVRFDRTSPVGYWKPLTVMDQTHGFTEDGKVYFELPQMWRASRFWDANGNGIGGPAAADRTPRLYIRVQRRLTRNVTAPTLSYLQTINQPYIVIPPDEMAPSGLYLADTVEQVARFVPRSRYVIERPPLFPTVRFNNPRRS